MCGDFLNGTKQNDYIDGATQQCSTQATAAHEREHAVGSDDAEVDTDTDLAWHATSELRQWRCGLTEDGQRLDRVLAMLVPEFSRNHLSQLVERGAVQVNGRQVTNLHTSSLGRQWTNSPCQATPQSQAFRPENACIYLVYEDEHLLVLNKPAGLVVASAAPDHWSGTLLNGLLAGATAQQICPDAGDSAQAGQRHQRSDGGCAYTQPWMRWYGDYYWRQDCQYTHWPRPRRAPPLQVQNR